MNRFLWLLPALLLLSQQPAPAGGWKKLFNGKNLDGWKRIGGSAAYTIEDGAITGRHVLDPSNTFLTTGEEYGDFILEMEVMADSGINSGIQIRSHSLPDYQNGRVHGLQVELDPSPRAWSGGLYDEARRGWLYPMEQNPKGGRAFKAGTWNTFRIEAIGNSIRTWINGIPCADLADTLTEKGFIALQVHGTSDPALVGKTVRWRNIRIKTEELTPSAWTDIPVVNLVPNTLTAQEKAQGWKLLFDGQTTEGWRGAHKETFPASGWKVEKGELVVQPSAGAESKNGGDIVTKDAYSLFELSLEFKLAPGANSGVKYFVTEQYASSGSAIGLEFQLLDDALHPDAKLGAGGNRTLASLYDLIPAHPNKQVNAPGNWNYARLIVSGVRLDTWLKNNQIETTEFRGAHVEHWLNRRRVLSYERGDQAFGALVARSKYVDYAGFGMWQSGRILLQDHGDEVHFRSIKIRELGR